MSFCAQDLGSMASICNPKWIDPAKQRGLPKEDPLIPSPPPTPPKVVALRAKSVQPEVAKRTCTPKRLPMARKSLGTRGNRINLLTNHFQVRVSKPDGVFYHYSVAIFYEDKTPVDESKGIGRKVMDKVYETYKTELAHKEFAYDGEKSLFTVGPLPQNKLEFTIILDDMFPNKVGRDGSPGPGGDQDGGDKKRLRRQSHSKTFLVEISYAAKIPLQAIADALRGRESEHSQEGLRVLDIILRQNAAKQGCLLVRQSFFQDRPCNFNDLGGGILRFRGCHSSFRATQGGLTLNLDMSSTMILRPGPVVDFLLCNQNVRSPDQIDWRKARKMLKNLRIKTNNMEYTIAALSDKPCKEQTFEMRLRGQVDRKTVELTVYEYYRSFKHMEPYDSAYMPCIIVGKKNRPTYFPMEFCTLVSLQRYTKALTVPQRAALVEVSRQKPQERMKALSFSLRDTTYASDPMLNALGISINSQFTHVEGRVLQAPKLRVGNGEDFFPRNGRWNFNNKTLVDPVKIERWAIVNFSARCDTRNLVNEMMKSGEKKGIRVSPPFTVVEENPQFRREQPTTRVEKLFEALKAKLPGPPQFLLCILPEKKNSDIYGPWKRKNLSEMGIVTQCIAPTRVNDQYLTNVLLKVNAKLGGMNSLLTVERNLPLVSQSPTLIIGMDVSHGSPGRSDAPSVAAVVGSRCWPSISHYRAEVRTQSPKVEMIASLFQPVSDTTDEGIIRMLLQDFYTSSNSMKPEQIIIFRDGVSESQFNQVLNIELDQIIEACKFLDSSWSPKFTVIIAQKNHNTRFFQPNSPDNVPPGTIIDSTICHPKNNDFYLCAHAGMIGTTRPTHYHVLYDELGFSTDDMQELVHSLSYVYQRSTTAISVVAPVCYAHLAAYQMSQFIKFDDMSESSSSHGGVSSPDSIHVPELPKLHKNVCNSMFFC